MKKSSLKLEIIKLVLGMIFLALLIIYGPTVVRKYKIDLGPSICDTPPKDLNKCIMFNYLDEDTGYLDLARGCYYFPENKDSK